MTFNKHTYRYLHVQNLSFPRSAENGSHGAGPVMPNYSAVFGALHP